MNEDNKFNPGSTATGSTGTTNSYNSGGNLGATGSGNIVGSGIGTTSGETFSSATMDFESRNALGATEAVETTGMSAGVVSILERFGVHENQINAVRETLKNLNIEQSLDKAREQVGESIGKAREYAKQNPGAVLAGLSVLVIGAGLIAGAAMKKDRD